jgi:hypothetical protein
MELLIETEDEKFFVTEEYAVKVFKEYDVPRIIFEDENGEIHNKPYDQHIKLDRSDFEDMNQLIELARWFGKMEKDGVVTSRDIDERGYIVPFRNMNEK